MQDFFHHQYTLPKFNSSPLKSYLPNKKGSSSNHPFSGETSLLNFRWVTHEIFFSSQLWSCQGNLEDHPSFSNPPFISAIKRPWMEGGENNPRSWGRKQSPWLLTTEPSPGMILQVQLPKTNSSPLKIGQNPKGRIVFQPFIFRGKLSPLTYPLEKQGFHSEITVRETNGTSFVSRFRSSFLEVQGQVYKTMGGSLFCVVQDNYGKIYTMIHI